MKGVVSHYGGFVCDSRTPPNAIVYNVVVTENLEATPGTTNALIQVWRRVMDGENGLNFPV